MLGSYVLEDGHGFHLIFKGVRDLGRFMCAYCLESLSHQGLIFLSLRDGRGGGGTARVHPIYFLPIPCVNILCCLPVHN